VFERLVVKLAARLFGMRLDQRDRNRRQPIFAALVKPCVRFAPIGRRRDQRFLPPSFAEQRRQPSAELAPRLGTQVLAFVVTLFGTHAAILSLGSRPISSRARAMYARLPLHEWSYTSAGKPWLGASDSRTFRGITASNTSGPRHSRTSSA